MDQADEIARLRARVAELEAERAEAAASTPGDAPARRSSTRAAFATVLIVLGCVLAPVSVLSVWASSVLTDGEQYVQTMAPIADDPGVQAAIADAVTNAIIDNLDVAGITSSALDTLAGLENMPPRVADALPALAAPLTRGIESFTQTQAMNFVTSDEFGRIWDEVNGEAHEQVVALLEGNPDGVVTSEDGTIALNLAPVIAEVKARLVDRGFELAAQIPEVDRSFTLVESPELARAQRWYSMLNTFAAWPALLGLACLAAGIALAHDRRKALLRGALGVTATMVLMGVGLALVRTLYVETTPADLLPASSAGNVYDSLIRFLRTSMRSLAVLGLVVALAAYLSGPTQTALRTRQRIAGVLGSWRGSAQSAGLLRGPVPTWVYTHRSGLRAAVLLVGGFTLVFWDRPTGWVVVGVAVCVLLALALIEFVGNPSPPTEDPIAAQPTDATTTASLPTQSETAADAERQPAIHP